MVDTLLIIPNQNLFRVANEKTTFADAFAMADQVLYSGVACITDLMVKEGLINLDFADVRAVMREMGKAMMGTGEASGEKRALTAAEAAISNPLIDDASMKGARGLLISITGGKDLTLYEVDEAATRIREEVDPDANIIVGATFDESLEGIIRVSVVATGIDKAHIAHQPAPAENALKELAGKMRAESARTAERIERAAPARTVAVESAAHAAVAAALMPAAGQHEDVSIRPMPMKPSLFDAVPAERWRSPRRLRPRRSSRRRRSARARTPRMPRIDELPLPAQNEIRAQRGDSIENQPEKQRHVADAAARQCRPRPSQRGGAGAAEPRTWRRRCRNTNARSARARASRKAVRPSRCPNTAAAPRRRGSIRTAARLLCITRTRRTSSTFRPFCAGRRTDRRSATRKAAPFSDGRRGPCFCRRRNKALSSLKIAGHRDGGGQPAEFRRPASPWEAKWHARGSGGSPKCGKKA